MSTWGKWLKAQTDVLADGVRDFTTQLTDDTADVRQEVSSHLQDANEKLAEVTRVVGDKAEKIDQLSFEDMMKRVEGALVQAERGTSQILARGAEKLREVTEVAEVGPSGVKTAGPEAASGSSQRLEERVRAMEADPSTFASPPADAAGFSRWCETFELLAQTSQIEVLLRDREPLRATHTALVPAVVPYRIFWQRYFYALDQLQQQEQRRLAMLRRVDAPTPAAKLSSWGDFDDADGFEDAPLASSAARAKPLSTSTLSGSSRPALPKAPNVPKSPFAPKGPLATPRSPGTTHKGPPATARGPPVPKSRPAGPRALPGLGQSRSAAASTPASTAASAAATTVASGVGVSCSAAGGAAAGGAAAGGAVAGGAAAGGAAAGGAAAGSAVAGGAAAGVAGDAVADVEGEEPKSVRAAALQAEAVSEVTADVAMEGAAGSAVAAAGEEAGMEVAAVAVRKAADSPNEASHEGAGSMPGAPPAVPAERMAGDVSAADAAIGLAPLDPPASGPTASSVADGPTSASVAEGPAASSVANSEDFSVVGSDFDEDASLVGSAAGSSAADSLVGGDAGSEEAAALSTTTPSASVGSVTPTAPTPTPSAPSPSPSSSTTTSTSAASVPPHPSASARSETNSSRAGRAARTAASDPPPLSAAPPATPPLPPPPAEGAHGPPDEDEDDDWGSWE